ncbi:DnaA N-terminal domain-containing protein [Bacillus toyonensis]|uniref:DnaA N-terminal domain-containing protein n=1 Tax=Bacillus toyonensis TaxID=155322 RepID=A0A2B5Y2K2_9BACI|nr:DnaA N-terminal domain-containing protein [Bacillus toyonensis]PGB02472.1 hypothetical protein COL93_11870 [Bacillus toyonensis]PHD66107.1 hypothetical protein COF40_21540 [Bacillus toyonensis]
MKMNWNEVKEKIRPQISKPSYETWFSKTTVYLEDDLLTIYCPNEFARGWLESHYKELIFNTLREMFNTTFEIQFDEFIDKPSKLKDVQIDRTNIWNEVKKALRPKLAEKSFMRWIRNTKAVLEGNTLTIFCEDAFHRDLLEGEYKDLISSTVQKVTDEEYNIWFNIESNITFTAHVHNEQNNEFTSEQGEFETIWKKIKDKIQLTISRSSYETWIKKTTAQTNGDLLKIYFENEFQQQFVEKSYKDLISLIAEELTVNTYELQFELKSNNNTNRVVEKLKSSPDSNVFELWEKLKSSDEDLKYSDRDDSDKRIQALEEKIVNLEKVVGTLMEKLEVVKSKTQLGK